MSKQKLSCEREVAEARHLAVISTLLTVLGLITLSYFGYEGYSYISDIEARANKATFFIFQMCGSAHASEDQSDFVKLLVKDCYGR